VSRIDRSLAPGARSSEVDLLLVPYSEVGRKDPMVHLVLGSAVSVVRPEVP
jgi:hypothetical protein